ncbi:hypothetical protein [Lysobacter gummosus]
MLPSARVVRAVAPGLERRALTLRAPAWSWREPQSALRLRCRHNPI